MDTTIMLKIGIYVCEDWGVISVENNGKRQKKEFWNNGTRQGTVILYYNI